MSELQSAKKAVRHFHEALDRTSPDGIEDVIKNSVAIDYVWRGVHPFGELQDVKAVAENFWVPLKKSLSRLQRRDDIFFAGHNEMDGCNSVWVIAMGHLLGLFDKSFLGISPTGKLVMMRYCTFHRVADEQIVETCMHVDIPQLMIQAGESPFPPQTGANLIQPGPYTHDGLLFEPQSKSESEATLAAINSMITNLGQWKSGLPLEEELALDWHDDMFWWGPVGIGSTYTIERYAKQHAGPFRAGFKDRTKTNHICRTAEGHYGGFFGWPNFTAEPSGGFMGMEATGKSGEFRVIDIYRRQGDKLAENWVFIDLPHFWKQQGFDVLAG